MRRFSILIVIMILAFGLAASAAVPEKQWTVSIKGISSYVCLPDGGIALAAGNRIVSLNREGRQEWSWTAKAAVGYVAVDDKGAIYATYSNKVVKLDRSGKSVWEKGTFDKAYALAVMEGGVFVGWEYGLIKFDADGNLEWEYYRPEDC